MFPNFLNSVYMVSGNTLWNIVEKSSQLTNLAYTSKGKICYDLCENLPLPQ